MPFEPSNVGSFAPLATIPLPLDAVLELPAKTLATLVHPDRLVELLHDLGPGRAAWLLGGGEETGQVVRSGDVVALSAPTPKASSPAAAAPPAKKRTRKASPPAEGSQEPGTSPARTARRRAEIATFDAAIATEEAAKATEAERSSGIVLDVQGALTTKPQTAHAIAKYLREDAKLVGSTLRQLVDDGAAVKCGTGKGVSFAASVRLISERDPGGATVPKAKGEPKGKGKHAGESGATEERVLHVLRHRDELRGVRTPLELGAIVCDAATMGGAGYDLTKTTAEMPALLERMVTDGKVVREADDYSLPITADAAPVAEKPKRGKAPIVVTTAQRQAVLDALKDSEGGRYSAARGGEVPERTAGAIAWATKLPLDVARRCLDILVANGQAFARVQEHGPVFWKDSGPPVVDASLDEDEATAPTDPLTTDDVLEMLEEKGKAYTTVQLASLLDRTTEEVCSVLDILMKPPVRVTATSEGAFRRLADGETPWAGSASPKLNGRSKRRAKGQQLTVPGA